MKENSIFIVEDNPVISDLITWRLTEMGYQVIGSAEESEEAMSKIHEFRPSLILMDINLPGERDGIDLAGEIAEKYAIPVVFISSLLDEPIIERAKRVNPRGYIVKPFTDNQLRASVEMALKN